MISCGSILSQRNEPILAKQIRKPKLVPGEGNSVSMLRLMTFNLQASKSICLSRDGHFSGTGVSQSIRPDVTCLYKRLSLAWRNTVRGQVVLGFELPLANDS